MHSCSLVLADVLADVFNLSLSQAKTSTYHLPNHIYTGHTRTLDTDQINKGHSQDNTANSFHTPGEQGELCPIAVYWFGSF